jgi:uncharacterized protein (TIGR03000 family)
MRKCLVFGSALTLVALFALVDVAQAQRRGGRGRGDDGYYGGGYYGDGYRSGWGWGGRYGGYGYYPGYAQDWGNNGYNNGYGYGSENYNGGLYAGNYGYPSNDSGYGGYGYGGDCCCGSYGYMSPSQGYYGGYSGDFNQGDMYAGQQPYGGFAGQSNTAAIRVILPNPQAKVWFEGQGTQQTGTDRFFISPELQPGNYVYTVKASWMQNGHEVTREKQVKVSPGRGAMVDFARQAGNRGSMAGSEPLPRPGERYGEFQQGQQPGGRYGEFQQGQEFGTPPPQGGRHGEFQQGQEPGTHRGELQGNEIHGVVVSAKDDQIVVTDTNGENRRTFHLGSSAEVMLNGNKSQINDLKPGMHVTLMLDKNNPKTVERIDAAPAGTGGALNNEGNIPPANQNQPPATGNPNRSQPLPPPNTKGTAK